MERGSNHQKQYLDRISRWESDRGAVMYENYKYPLGNFNN